MVHHQGSGRNFQVEVVEKVVPPDATHCLRCGYRNFFGYTQEEIKDRVRSTVVPVANGVLSPLGWEYIDVECYGNYFEIYYKSSPVEPVTVGTVITILTLVCIIIIGLVITYCAWVYLETKKMEAQAKADKKKLLDEGKITKEQYTELIGSQKEEDMMESLKWLLILFVVIIIIGAIAPILPKRREKE